MKLTSVGQTIMACGVYALLVAVLEYALGIDAISVTGAIVTLGAGIAIMVIGEAVEANRWSQKERKP